MLDLGLYRSARQRPQRWHGLRFGIRPLPYQLVSDLEREHLRQSTRIATLVGQLGFQSAVLAEAVTDLRTGRQVFACGEDVARVLSPRKLAELYRLWEAVEAEHLPDVEQLEAEIELQLADEVGEATLDATAAAAADSPADFYGLPMARVTCGQLIYYQLLRVVHERINDPEKKRCRRSRHVLRQRARRSYRSETSNGRARRSKRSHGRARSARSGSFTS